MAKIDSGLLVAVTFLALICPPLATAVLCGCTPDVLLNFILCFFGWLPGMAHVIYLIFIAFYRQSRLKDGKPATEDAPMVFSKRIQELGRKKIMKETSPTIAANVEPVSQPVVERPGLVERPNSEPEFAREGITA
ncbi:hypothetical protein QBC43DRAFT_130817 [Cladorrhinum sp. PSN259]|nr:hypothetical protein QBC43DRAFT_130817 [Cladorrhinum sp. PSN259]